MTDEELQALHGLPIDQAKVIVAGAGWKATVIHEDQIRTMACLPPDVVELNHDDDLIVTLARTQASIDRKYA